MDSEREKPLKSAELVPTAIERKPCTEKPLQCPGGTDF